MHTCRLYCPSFRSINTWTLSFTCFWRIVKCERTKLHAQFHNAHSISRALSCTHAGRTLILLRFAKHVRSLLFKQFRANCPSSSDKKVDRGASHLFRNPWELGPPEARRKTSSLSFLLHCAGCVRQKSFRQGLWWTFSSSPRTRVVSLIWFFFLEKHGRPRFWHCWLINNRIFEGTRGLRKLSIQKEPWNPINARFLWYTNGISCVKWPRLVRCAVRDGSRRQKLLDFSSKLELWKTALNTSLQSGQMTRETLIVRRFVNAG